ncbi:pantoate--beta-alanine ligase [Dyadobacter psychrotolerans]|uniref:Pantothenate synthetase n=1 Tax=Dyadobacter psychrotolerans TaxID=2541721 RepID=A0A4R5DBL4_9BACT|nr:pantoate--beta-alanine ligase [Dyadobacter psychrotolerans]TDE11069.1 pantoate--beta-alanine ligase [Dyadobacter psychrotolerans]
MEVFTSIQSLRSFLHQQRSQNKSIGLVPTMGALHEGHISLLDTAKSETDITVCSVFVNPTQFNNSEDLAKYPRTLEQDCKMLEEAGCSAVFAPSVDEMYPEPPVMTFNFGTLETVMEGASRPGHFNGVGIVVSKLFNIVQADSAYFGQKDLQQVSVIRQMISDLAFPVKLVVCPTVREVTGLAMSSRNQRLSAQEKDLAANIYQIITAAKDALLNAEAVENVKQSAVEKFLALPEFTLDYIEIVDVKTLLPLDRLKTTGSTAICVAALLGPVRLIDNIVF